MICVLVMGAAYVVFLSAGLIDPIGEGAAFPVDGIGADTVVLRYELAAGGKSAVVHDMVTLTDPSAVGRILSIHNAMLLKNTHRSIDKERYALYFYQNGELVERWHFDGKGLVDFSTRHGTYSVENDNFDMAYITGLVG